MCWSTRLHRIILDGERTYTATVSGQRLGVPLTMAINLDEEVRLWATNSERESIENFSTLYGLIVSLEYLERAYVRDSVSSKESV